MKKNTLKRGVILAISILVALVLYITSFDINENNMEVKLGDYLNEPNINIIEIQEIIRGNDKDLVVFFKTNNSYGVALLNKGLNNKYLINDAFKANDKIDSIIYKADGLFYTTIYGGDNKKVSKVKLSLESRNKTIEINSKNIFTTKPIRIYQASGEIIYERSSVFDPYQLELNSVAGSTWKSILVPLACALVIILSNMATSIIFKKFNNTKLHEYNDISTDGQRIKQSWYDM